jgi:hypothetical protein
LFFQHFVAIIEARNLKKNLYEVKETEAVYTHAEDRKKPRPSIINLERLNGGEENEAEAVDGMMQLINEIDLSIKPPTEPIFYYYKRWIWIIFPWACLQTDRKYNFSDLIAECYSSNIRYLSVHDEYILFECNAPSNKTPRRS